MKNIVLKTGRRNEVGGQRVQKIDVSPFDNKRL